MIEIASIVVLFLTFMGFTVKRTLTYMHVFQQEEYDSGRLIKWIVGNSAFDKRLTLILAMAVGASFFIEQLFVTFIIFFGFALMTFLEKDPRKDSKKKLVSTARAKRIFYPSYILSVVAGSWCFIAPQESWIWILNVHLIPFMIMVVNLFLSPFEEMIQKKFLREAQNKVADLQPTVIGITGSFGKTSVKHILGHILKMDAPTLITPGSVNTPMGITRIIREQLTEEHKYLVVEMGAYGPGSIKRLCDLTPPDMGIITAIGHAHYERFKSLDTVAKTKYELAQSTLRKDDGQMIIHERTLRFDVARAIKEQAPDNFIVCGEPPPVDASKQVDKSYLKKGDLEIQAVEQRSTGLEVKFHWKSTLHIVEAPLYGLHHGHNIVLAFVAAFELGVPAQDIQAALNTLPQIEHRLEVKKQADGTTIIDDAYNSNPVGFQSALSLMTTIATGRKILITPGMVELGKAHNEAHAKIGESAGELCDVAIVVKGKRIPTFIKGFKKTGNGKTLKEVDTFDDAQKWVAKNKQSGDTILIENDLPDMYERIPKI